MGLHRLPDSRQHGRGQQKRLIGGGVHSEDSQPCLLQEHDVVVSCHLFQYERDQSFSRYWRDPDMPKRPETYLSDDHIAVKC
eukprot:1979136-Prymnesium_polylepis.2